MTSSAGRAPRPLPSETPARSAGSTTATDAAEPDRAPYYRRDLARVHHLGFGFHADMCAPGILELLERVRQRRGLVVEFGCGSGLLTKHLVDAGHRVIATDASPAMLELARDHAPGAEGFVEVRLPDDLLPEADAIVSTGHPLNYLPDEAALERAVVAIAGALAPGGVCAFDVCDLEWGEARREQPDLARVEEDWALITRFSVPAPNLYVRELTTFLRNQDGSWQRDDELHENVLIDTSKLPELISEHGVEAELRESFGSETLPVGLKVVVGRKPG